MNLEIQTTEIKSGFLAPYLQEKKQDYYGLPPVKHSDYGWTIGTSLFAVGMSGALGIITTLLDSINNDEKEPLVRTGRYSAFAASIAAAALYIKDLGTPVRWLNMLRIFRPTSLMSMGVWALTVMGAFNGLSAFGQAIMDIGYKNAGVMIKRIAGIPAAAIGLFVSMYTGTELEETSTPLWARSAPLLPVLFAANNMSSSLSLLELAGTSGNKAKNPVSSLIRRIGMLNFLLSTGQLFVLKRIEQNWTGKFPFDKYQKRQGLLYRTGAVASGIITSLIITVLAMRKSPNSAKLLKAGSLIRLISGYFLPVALLFYGNKTANKPEDYFEFTRTEKSGPQATVILKSGPQQDMEKEIKKKRNILGILIVAAATAAAIVVDRMLEKPFKKGR